MIYTTWPTSWAWSYVTTTVPLPEVGTKPRTLHFSAWKTFLEVIFL